MSEWVIAYSLTPEQYSAGASLAGTALKAGGKTRAIRVGIAEIATAVAGVIFFKNAAPLFYALLLGIFALGVYSISFYQFIFPRSVAKKTYAAFVKGPAYQNEITLTFLEDEVVYEVGDTQSTLDWESMTSIVSEDYLVLTSSKWSAVVPRSAIPTRFEEMIEKLEDKELHTRIKL